MYTPFSELDTYSISASFESESPEALREVDLSSRYIPSRIEGKISTSISVAPKDLIVAICVNGRIEGVTQSYIQDGQLHFAHVLSDDLFKATGNKIEFILLPLPNEQ